jgi:hypothetical protein
MTKLFFHYFVTHHFVVGLAHTFHLPAMEPVHALSISRSFDSGTSSSAALDTLCAFMKAIMFTFS